MYLRTIINAMPTKVNLTEKGKIRHEKINKKAKVFLKTV